MTLRPERFNLGTRAHVSFANALTQYTPSLSGPVQLEAGTSQRSNAGYVPALSIVN